jgi:hypothetical protein
LNEQQQSDEKRQSLPGEMSRVVLVCPWQILDVQTFLEEFLENPIHSDDSYSARLTSCHPGTKVWYRPTNHEKDTAVLCLLQWAKHILVPCGLL